MALAGEILEELAADLVALHTLEQSAISFQQSAKASTRFTLTADRWPLPADS
jgi:hypothetical protein